MSARRIVIVGNSAAGLAAVEAIRRRDDRCPVTLVGEEARPAYSRVMLPYLLSGEREDISLRASDYYRRMRVEALLGRRAVALEADRLILDDGARLPFDRLLLATGSRAAVPDIPGVNLPGVFAMKTMADALAVRERLPGVRDVVILGGGLICLLVVRALLKQGRSVSLVVASDRLLSRLLDAGGAAIVHRRLAEAGVQVLTRTDARAIVGSDGKASAVVTADGRELPADLVILAKGIRSDVELAQTGGLATARGILVDEYCRTSRADIYAAGDCAEAPDLLTPGKRTIPGNWFEAVGQGEAAGGNMLDAVQPAPGALKMNVMEAVHTPVASIGMLEPPDAEGRALIRERDGIYRKLVISRDRLVGAVLVGDVTEAGLLAMLIRQRASLSALRHLDLSRRVDYASFARG
jgi:NAD(P)H-nitrite reductase large subunit